MRHLVSGNAGSMALLVFFILGWAYYMTATILMKGSLFIGMRDFVALKANQGSWFFGKVEEMLGCLMCTATEAALWTLGISTFVLGFRFGVAGDIVGGLLGAIGIKTGEELLFPWPVEALLMVAISFALSLAVSGEAWAIKTIVEHREVKFLALREDFRTREVELLRRIRELESKRVANGTDQIEYDFS